MRLQPHRRRRAERACTTSTTRTPSSSSAASVAAASFALLAAVALPTAAAICAIWPVVMPMATPCIRDKACGFHPAERGARESSKQRRPPVPLCPTCCIHAQTSSGSSSFVGDERAVDVVCMQCPPKLHVANVCARVPMRSLPRRRRSLSSGGQPGRTARGGGAYNGRRGLGAAGRHEKKERPEGRWGDGGVSPGGSEVASSIIL